jgi:hypothetical protein
MARGVRRDKVVEVGGLEAADWWNMYMHTHPKLQRIEWPDGGCYLQQLQITVDVFELIEAEVNQFLKEKNGKRN